MYPKSRDLEIVYNLLWKSKPHQVDDRANIIGMYDIPSTTLTWECFKSYILKNSGSNAIDIKLSYIDSDEKEVPIGNQTEFQLALYSFRRRARIGEIITLKIEKLNPRKNGSAMRVQSSDAESQTLECKDEATQLQEVVDDDVPPKWFTKYMKKFEKKLNDEIKQQLSMQAPKVPVLNCSHSLVPRPKSGKAEAHKRSRKFDLSKNTEKEACKQCKFEKKIESKLEKIEHKTNRLKAKKLAAMKISSDSDIDSGPTHEAKQTRSEKGGNYSESSSPISDVTLISSSDTTAGVLYTNSVYLQKWEVANSGQSAWDDRTELRYAWGSEKLRPTFTILKCPELQPGEKGEISVWFQIPSIAGSYECFWHFYDCGRRFGHWIGCQLTVVDFPGRFHDEPLLASPKVEQVSAQLEKVANEISRNELTGSDDEINRHMHHLLLTDSVPNNFESSPTSEVVSVLSGSNSPHSVNSDYVVIQSPEVGQSHSQIQQCADPSITCEVLALDAPQSDQSLAISTTQSLLSENEVKVTENATSDYAFVYYNGEKLAFPKHVLRPEYYDAAEKCEHESQKQSEPVENNGRRREESVSSEDSSKRLFVFPRYSPGFEVVYPTNRFNFDAQEYHSLDNYVHPVNAEDMNNDNPAGNQGITVDSTSNSLPPEATSSKSAETESSAHFLPFIQRRQQKPATKRENFISEAAILASSAMSTARNVVNKVIESGNGKWINGHWIADVENSRRELALRQLTEMGFTNRDLNATLLARYSDDVPRVISELIQ